MTLVKIAFVFMLAIPSVILTSIASFAQNIPTDPAIAPKYHAKCVFKFDKTVSLHNQVQIGLYKYCDGMKPQTNVTVELHGLATSRREAKWLFCASPGLPRSSVCRDGQISANTMGIEYKDVRPDAEVEISLGVRTIASRDGFAFAWVANLGCDAAAPDPACDVVLLPGATLTFNADAGQ